VSARARDVPEEFSPADRHKAGENGRGMQKYRAGLQRLASFFVQKMSNLLEGKDKVSTFAPLREGGRLKRGTGK